MIIQHACVSLCIFSTLHKMTAHVKLPVNNQDGLELEKIEDHVCDGSIPQTVMENPPRKMTGRSVSAVCRLSTISEQDKLDTDPSPTDPLGGSKWGGSGFSLCSDKLKNSSSHLSSDDSYQPGGGDDCAGLLLACLHCRFHEFMVLISDTCERAVNRCFPSYKYITALSERDQQGQECCNYKLELDCNCCGSCQDAGELIELAMEISEVCYR
ncbi:myoD family inhibitor domain-containing protein 2 [Gymnodraco acuticeps]|uniref:MyoD family inhibitor domain-containing protein 2 n=1 Tax=Gymnodraco acuticeps TaxID=8218 RepID=A0A6P8UM68_GYMAC|nr:myoD family inhibitor domain-containing protein 2 [Gymnodraco acuticeps]